MIGFILGGLFGVLVMCLLIGGRKWIKLLLFNF